MTQKDGATQHFGRYQMHHWMSALVLFITFVPLYVVSFFYLPQTGINLSYSVALCLVFFVGFEILPIVYFVALFSVMISGASIPTLIITPVGVVVQAGLGALLLRYWNVDPLFRRESDVFRLLEMMAVVAVIPVAERVVEKILESGVVAPTETIYFYVAAFFSLVLVVPFVLRWFSKWWFRRTLSEIVETASVFLLIIFLGVVYFIVRVPDIFGIPIPLLLLLPLYLVSLRLRPRFVTLAILCTSFLGIMGFLLHGTAEASEIFTFQLYISALAINFLIIASLEEHRRANANRFLSQVATLENAVARVSSESQAKNDFIAILGHELRNPLMPVVSGIEILKHKSGHTQEDSQLLDTMAHSMQTIKRLLNDLLDVAKISEGKVSLRKDRVDLDTVLHNALLSTDHHRKERHQSLVYEKAGEKLVVIGDSVRLEQIFSNLLTNASKYSNSGDTITLEIKREGKAAVIHVGDQGLGLDPSEVKMIFLPFTQADHGNATKDGLGIGLSLVRDLTRMHGGTVRAESPGRGKGSTFTVTLPLAKDE